jgi:hypothetical protein
MAGLNKYVRNAQHGLDPPPAVAVRYFYTSPLAIDDPLSPLPPPLSTSSSSYKVPPRPFSVYDNATIDKEWQDIRRRRIRAGAEQQRQRAQSSANSSIMQDTKRGSITNTSAAEAKRRSLVGSVGAVNAPASPRARPMARMPSSELISVSAKGRSVESNRSDDSRPSSLRLDPAESSVGIDTSTVTGNPFIRAPSRSNFGSSSRSRSTSLRPGAQKIDSYNWGDDEYLASDTTLREEAKVQEPVTPKPVGPSAKVPVGVSRLHEVVIPELQ